MSSPTPLVWFVTGTSQGFGLEIVRAALDRGDSVVATSRTPQAVAGIFPHAAERLLAVSLDLRDAAAVSEAVAQALGRFGRIDVLVNNAGHGIAGAVEEVADAEIAHVFETNIYGLLRLTRAVLPHMRERGSGRIVNLSSIGGIVGLPGWGIYNATKFAVEGISEALATEVGPLGLHVTLVEPGPFRTDFLGGSLAEAKLRIPAYDATAGKTRETNAARDGKQPGDPVKGARTIVAAVASEKPPLHLLLGKLAYDRATQKLDDLRAEYGAWKAETLGADFPEGQ